jgi:hypothetical protein
MAEAQEFTSPEAVAEVIKRLLADKDNISITADASGKQPHSTIGLFAPTENMALTTQVIATVLGSGTTGFSESMMEGFLVIFLRNNGGVTSDILRKTLIEKLQAANPEELAQQINSNVHKGGAHWLGKDGADGMSDEHEPHHGLPDLPATRAPVAPVR